MADGQQNFVENNEEQEFLMQQSAFEQQNIVGNFPEEYQFGVNESENQAMGVNEQSFAPHNEEPENNYGVLSDQVFADNQNEGIHGLDGDEMKQEFTNNEGDEAGNGPVNAQSDKKSGNENSLSGVGAEKKWPGWPGESVFRMLVPTQKVGNIIGRKGEYIKKMVEETRARIKVMDGPPGSQVRAVMVSAREHPDESLPPAMNGLLSVHKRVVDGLDADSSEAQAPAGGGKVSTKLLVPGVQAGSLIGKQGATVKSIQESASCIVRVLGQEDLPVFALQDDRVVEVVGEAINVHKAIELIASHLRKFLVDRSIIPIFEMEMQAPSKPMEHMPPQPWGPTYNHPQSGGGGLGGYNMAYMQPPPRQLDNYYQHAEMVAPPHQGISTYGREPPAGAHPTSNAQPAPSMITQITQHMQVPLIYAASVIGANGATVSYIRRASGATVTIQETRGAPGEMTVEISGTASQVQTAQQLIQNFKAEAAAAAAASATTAPTQTAGVAEQGGYSQGYNAYAAAPATVYGTTPASAGHATQPGAYGSVYGANYGY